MKLIPPLSYIEASSSAELRVGKLLDQIQGDSSAVAYHSVHLPEHEYKAMSEADFVVLWKGAVIVLEVKGGRLQRKSGVWIFTDRFGNEHTKAESPWQQAQSAMFALRKRIEVKLPAPRFPFSAVVVTPDQAFGADVEWAAWEHAGPADMTVDRLEKALSKAASVARSHAGQERPQPIQPLKALLRPDFDRVTRLADEADMIDRQMAALVEGQAELLEGLEANPRMVIEGGAGTGKTLLAVEAARRRSGHGERILFTCRSAGVVAFARKLLDGTDVECIPFDELGPDQSFDVVVVDEAQDILNFDDLPRLEAVIRGGIEWGSWWIFVDTNNQAHIDGSYDPELFDQMRAWSVVFRLRRNCRNTEPIVTQIQTLLGADLGAPRVGAGPKVGMVHARSDSAAIEGLDRELERLLDQGVNLNEVAIISLQSEPGDSLAWGSRVALRGDLGDMVSTKRVKLWTPQQIKGLESKHVLVVDVHDLSEPNAIQKLYVAMTRARVSLWMAIEDPAWNQLGEMAAQSIQGRTA